MLVLNANFPIVGSWSLIVQTQCKSSSLTVSILICSCLLHHSMRFLRQQAQFKREKRMSIVFPAYRMPNATIYELGLWLSIHSFPTNQEDVDWPYQYVRAIEHVLLVNFGILCYHTFFHLDLDKQILSFKQDKKGTGFLISSVCFN